MRQILYPWTFYQEKKHMYIQKFAYKSSQNLKNGKNAHAYQHMINYGMVYNGILLSNGKEQTVQTYYYNIDNRKIIMREEGKQNLYI